MRTITRETLIERLTELEPRHLVEPAVDGAIAELGWQDRSEFNGAEVMLLGTVMADRARQQFASSPDPALKRTAAEMAPLVDGMKEDVLPLLVRREGA